MRNVSKKWLAAALALAMVAVSVAACGSSSSGSGDKLAVGAPLPLTGPLAAQGQEMEKAYRLYLKQHGGKLGGIPIDLKVEDTQADTAQVVVKTRKLIANDQVTLIAGGALGPDSLAIRGLVLPAHMAFLTALSSADDLTQRKRSPLIARLGETSSQPNIPFGDYAFKKLHYKRVAIVAPDYGYGWESAGGFQYGFERAGGKVVAKIFAPLGVADWAPFVRRIPKDIDAVYALPVGSGVGPFVRTYDQLGYGKTTPLIGGPDLADEDALRAIGQSLIGVVHTSNYSTNVRQTRPFAKAYEAEYGSLPTIWGAGTYQTFQWMDKVLTNYRAKNDASISDTKKWIRDDPEAFIKAFRANPLTNGASGPWSIDSYNNAVLPIYIVKIIEKDGKPYRQVVDTIPNVSQFYTTPPEEFLAQPVFSRDFPPLK